MKILHTPVLLEESLELLAPISAPSFMVDATLGEGGHSYAFLSRFPALRILGIDADLDILTRARNRLAEFGERISFYNGWSQDYFAHFNYSNPRPDSILIDLGVSVFHYEESGRGFSFRKDEKLDMRIDPKKGESAAELIGRLSEKELADLIYNNADERYSRRIARAIVLARGEKNIETSAELAEIVRGAVPAAYRKGFLHPATKTFQALRIAVNRELARLPLLLDSALAVLNVGGRLGLITFHSLEDRLVKNFFRERARDCICPPTMPICKCGGEREVQILTRKAIRASEEEKSLNPPSRSAQLRVIEKKRERRISA